MILLLKIISKINARGDFHTERVKGKCLKIIKIIFIINRLSTGRLQPLFLTYLHSWPCGKVAYSLKTLDNLPCMTEISTP